MFREFRRRFWLPPRAHGDVIEDRTVSFLELFYDLVYVVVIARLAHHLAEHITWRGVGEFIVIFGLIWIGWLQGTLYYDLHGREDGRTRTFVFAQMLLLALLAVYTADAAGETGRQFAIVYALFLLLLTVNWYAVRRQDSEEYDRITARYLIGMVLSVAAVTVSVFMDSDTRLIIWAVFVVSWVFGSTLMARSADTVFEIGLSPTDSMVERFGLFTIIVLGEVVVGVVDGLSSSSRTPITIATGMVALMVGFSFWWTYFDFVGRRLPNPSAIKSSRWMMGHLPMTMAIAAAGAAMVSLIEHAEEGRAPVGTAWLMSGAVAVGLVSLVLIIRNLGDWDRLQALYVPVTRGLLVSAVAALVIGWMRPAPLTFVILLIGLLSLVWSAAVYQWLNLPNPDEIAPNSESIS